jgi:hypothetical protein
MAFVRSTALAVLGLALGIRRPVTGVGGRLRGGAARRRRRVDRPRPVSPGFYRHHMTTVSIADLGNVPAEYRHHPKTITPGDDLVLPAAHLKWYEVRREDAAVSGEVRDEARAFLRAETEAGRLEISGELGFAILHLCGESFYFLIVCTWRNVNEMWESVYTNDGSGFTPVVQGPHLEVICVWELGVVRHEQQAWTRYLYSARDERAKLAYLHDRLTGSA